MNFTIEMRTVFKNTSSPLKATANILFDDCFVVRNVKLIENDNGMFISMPSYKARDGEWRSVCHPINAECREELQAAFIKAYKKG